MPTRHRLLASLACSLTLALALVTPAWASIRGDVAALVNSSRGAEGLPTLSSHSGLDGVAQAWAEHLAEVGELSHNPDYASQIPSGWTSAAENVAYNSAPTAQAMHGQLMNSAGHRANIMGDFTHIGIGYATDGEGGGWLVEVFAAYPGGSGSTTPPSAPSVEPTTTESSAATSPPTTAEPTPVPDGWLGLGSSGAEVRALQEDLAALGYEVVPDGEFGGRTRDRVAEFQADAGLQADGLAGPQTLAAIEDAVAAEATEPEPTTTEPSTAVTEETSEAPPSGTPDIVPTDAARLTSMARSADGIPATGVLIGALGAAGAGLVALLLVRRRLARR